MPEHLCDYLLLEKHYVAPSPYIENMIKSFKESGIVQEAVHEVFRRLDRKLFLVTDLNAHLVPNGQRIVEQSQG